MLRPVRCFSCGKVLRFEAFDTLMQDKDKTTCQVLDKMGYTRMCCRTNLMTCIKPLDKTIAEYDMHLRDGLPAGVVEIKRRENNPVVINNC